MWRIAPVHSVVAAGIRIDAGPELSAESQWLAALPTWRAEPVETVVHVHARAKGTT